MTNTLPIGDYGGPAALALSIAAVAAGHPLVAIWLVLIAILVVLQQYVFEAREMMNQVEDEITEESHTQDIP